MKLIGYKLLTHLFGNRNEKVRMRWGVIKVCF